MPVIKPLRVTEYLASHPQDLNVTFSFPDGRQLGANRMLLSASCEAFEAMFSGDWKEETVINLSDTNLGAFKLFVRILYSESVELREFDLLTLDQLYYLGDKYIIEEIKRNVIAATTVAIQMNMNIERLSLLEHIKSDPMKDMLTIEILDFLSSHRLNNYVIANRGAVEDVMDLAKLAKFYCSGKFKEPFMEAMMKAALIFIEDRDEEGVERSTGISNNVFTDLPETEENFKFMFKVMQMKEQ